MNLFRFLEDKNDLCTSPIDLQMFHGMSKLILWQLFICELGIWLSAWLTYIRPKVWAHYCMIVHPMNSGTAVGEAEGWILWLVWKRWNSVSKHKQTNASVHTCETEERGNRKRRWKGGEGRREKEVTEGERRGKRQNKKGVKLHLKVNSFGHPKWTSAPTNK